MRGKSEWARKAVHKEVQRDSLCGTHFTSLLPGSTINLLGTTWPLPSRISTKRLTWDRHTGFTSEPINQMSCLCVDEVRSWYVVLQWLGHVQGTGLDPQYLNNANTKKRKKESVICVAVFQWNIDSLCVIRNVCQTQIVLFFLQRLTCLMQRAITHWDCTELLLWTSVCVYICVCEQMSGYMRVCVCTCVWDKDHLCSVGSQWIQSQSVLCQLAFDLSLSRLRLRLSHLAGHTRFSLSLPPPLYPSLSLSFCLSLFFSLHTRCIQEFTSRPALLTHIPYCAWLTPMSFRDLS